MDRFKRQLCKAFEARLKGRKERVPDGGAAIIDMFLALSRARSYGAHGPNPIAWEALAAWAQVMRVPIEPHHADIIMALDGVWMDHAMNHKAAPEGVKVLPPISQHPISAALIDVVMR